MNSRSMLSAWSAVAALVLTTQYSSAQTPSQITTHPELYVEVQDSIFVKRILAGDTIPASEFLVSASYQYEMIYDSTSRVGYIFSECRHNGTRPRLLAWSYRRLVTAPIAKLNDSSRTEDFAISTGDTVSFYRELRWYNPKNHRQDTNNYYSPDTLDYAVELVDAANGERLKLLDSLGALPSPSPGVPVFYGTRPIIALARYIIPSSMNGKMAFVRVLLYARGDGAYNPVRLDMPTIGISKSVDSPNLGSYLQKFGGGLNKPTIRGFNEGREAPDSGLDLSHISRDVVKMDFTPSEGGGSVSIIIYDALGNPTFVPFTTRHLSAPESLTYRFPSSGTYFIVLVRDDEISSVKKVVITN